jgi:hydrogenase maturation protein HypF
MPVETTVGVRIEIRGVVQGVGFRPWIYRLATEEGLAGHVRNDATGVTIEAFGSEEALERFMRRLDPDKVPATFSPPPAAVIDDIRYHSIPPEAVDTFSIVHSEETAGRRISIPPDLATCPACVAEIFDPGDRRYRYPFTNCTNCGPRFTITRDVPYDRPVTTMAAFRMCSACQREYDSVTDRRFHAQPNACPVCGPSLTLMGPDGRTITHEDPIAVAAAALAAERVVAIKGLGGFHLACDATSADAVQRLRVRKRRDEKPFAVMVRDLEEADEIAVLNKSERRLLSSVERPIVLVRRRPDSGLAAEVAPNNPLVGLMLPYTPLHHLLMNEVRRPLVMTSGNLSEEPLAYRNDEAVTRLGNLADLFVMHDRGIETRCDDSVARIIADRPVVLRRARGYVPGGIAVRLRFDVPVLACGALLKNTFCIGLDDTAYLGPHIGDLENLETYGSFEESIARMERFLRVSPGIIAHDLHPEYLSTTYALARPEPIKIGVQHHHAHIVSAMAEHGLSGPVIGVAYDGTGYGTDGTAWGGEVLLAQADAFERVATLRPVALAGADSAIRSPWRIALALLEDAFDGRAPLDALPLFSAVPAQDVSVVRQMIETRFRSPLAHGAGRYFDGVGSLVLARPESRYEGQIALEWNVVADPAEHGRYEYGIDRRGAPWEVDLRPMIRQVVRDLRAGSGAPTISARFHNTITAATADVVRSAAAIHGVLPVVLTGGCFQNARLAESLAADLSSGFTVHLHRRVPPGDGGLALGQAVIAAATARRLMK